MARAFNVYLYGLDRRLKLTSSIFCQCFTSVCICTVFSGIQTAFCLLLLTDIDTLRARVVGEIFYSVHHIWHTLVNCELAMCVGSSWWVVNIKRSKQSMIFSLLSALYKIFIEAQKRLSRLSFIKWEILNICFKFHLITFGVWHDTLH